jgi:hypothetical protein
LLGLSDFGSSFLVFFANKLTIYSIVVGKGVICFGSKCGWDMVIVILGRAGPNLRICFHLLVPDKEQRKIAQGEEDRPLPWV